MAKWTGVITNAGNSLLNEWVNENTLRFDRVTAGSGTVAPEAMLAQSALLKEQQIVSIIGAEKIDAGIRLKIQITAPEIGYTLNQFGVWASVNTGATAMIALFQHEQGIPVPSKSDHPDFVYTFYALISASNTSPWTVTVDTSAFVTRETLDIAIAGPISHLTNKNNPHNVTADQLGLGNVDNTADADKPVSTAQATAIAEAKKAGTDAQANLTAHNTNTGAHADLRMELKALADRINAVLDSDDETLDELSEIVAYIKSNKTLIDAITTSKVNVSDIVDNLVTNVANRPISAAQGVVLKGLIDTLQNKLHTENWVFTLEDGSTVTKAVYVG